MVLGELLMQGCLTNLDNSRTRAFCTCGKCGWGCLDVFFSRPSFLSSFSLSSGEGSIQTEILSERVVHQTKQPNCRERGRGSRGFRFDTLNGKCD